MAAVDCFYLLYREISRSCNFYIEALAIVGARYSQEKAGAALIFTLGFLFSITGSTDGIRKAYAEELVKCGVNIILISRNKEKLEAISRSISETYKVETDFIVADFSKGQIGILVNNVGMFYSYLYYFTNLSEDMLWDMININIASANMMTRIMLPGTVEKKGAIVNISSASCCQPTPMLTIYGASKIYLDYLRIFVQSLTPFVISTKMTTCSGMASERSFFFPSPEEYASNAISTLRLSSRTTGYWKHAIIMLLWALLPIWLKMYFQGVEFKA
uniref:Hydroxysteroid dehydrogenase like 1 n=1 Tax=Strigops habroptila TaxID=2489341 RepID=A0A672THJ0_STRHB